MKSGEPIAFSGFRSGDVYATEPSLPSTSTVTSRRRPPQQLSRLWSISDSTWKVAPRSTSRVAFVSQLRVWVKLPRLPSVAFAAGPAPWVDDWTAAPPSATFL